VSQFERQLFQDAVRPRRGRLLVIPNGVTPLPPVTNASPSVGPVITSVGRLERYKGHHRLIEALPAIVKRRPFARAVILGTGPHEPELRELADRLGVADRVEIGSVPAGDRTAMARRLAAADLVVLLSEYEAHPVSLLEAASAGRSVLVARTSGLTELVEAGLARGTAADASADRLAEDILTALRSPATTAGAALPTWDQTTDSLLAEYRACLPDLG
jgi:glycosyltransferase involved in cell wall biosynthesis